MAYVYAILVDGTPRYYGKGTKQRAFSHMTVVRGIARRREAGGVVETSLFYSLLTDAWLAGAIIEPVIVVDGLTHRQAFDLEASLIEMAGENVWNVHRPGKMTAKQRANHLAVMQSLEHRATKSAVSSGLWADPDYRDRHCRAMEIARQKPETKAKYAKAAADRWTNPTTRAKATAGISAAAKKRYANSLVQQILAFISGTADGATYTDISQALGVDRKKLINGITRLRKQGLIDDRSSDLSIALMLL